MILRENYEFWHSDQLMERKEKQAYIFWTFLFFYQYEMGVQESNAARCEDVQGHKPDEEQTQESANAYVIKRWFRKYVHKHYNYKFTLRALQSIAQEYILYHKIPELSEYQIFIGINKFPSQKFTFINKCTKSWINTEVGTW